MKKLSFTLLFTVIGVGFSKKCEAQTLPEQLDSGFYSNFYVILVKPMQFEMTYHYPFSDRLRIRVLDAEGRVLFTETPMVYRKYQKKFDLSIFHDGRYTFELRDAARRYEQSFSVATTTSRTVVFKGQREVTQGF